MQQQNGSGAADVINGNIKRGREETEKEKKNE